MMRLIVLKRLMEIKGNLEELMPQLDPNGKVYKDAKASLDRINKTLDGVDVGKLPKDVRIDTSKLKLRGNRLQGSVLMTDSSKVYFVTVENSEITDMKVYEGGAKKMEYLEATVFKNN